MSSKFGHKDREHGVLTLDPATTERIQPARRRLGGRRLALLRSMRPARGPAWRTRPPAGSLPAEASGSWWAPRSSKPLRGASLPWRVRFPSASATCTFARVLASAPQRSLPSGTVSGTVLVCPAVLARQSGAPKARRLLADQGLRRPLSADRQGAVRIRPRQDQARG